MSQQQQSTTTSTDIGTTFVPCPAPLASGDTVYDADGNAHHVASVTLRITTTDSDTALEVDLESRFGGWWAPATVTA